jgi:hypothetical protein
MINPIYHRYLNLPAEFINRDEIVSKYSNTEGFDITKNKQWRIDGGNPDIFNENTYKWLKQFDCEIGVCEIFYTAPKSGIRWHIDMSGFTPITNYVKINFVWGPESDNHYMQWGESIMPLEEHEVGYNMVGSPHMIFKNEEINKMESLVIDKPVLVRVGVPHRVVNDSDKGRWCLCLIPKQIKGGRLLWPQALDLFKDYMI